MRFRLSDLLVVLTAVAAVIISWISLKTAYETFGFPAQDYLDLLLILLLMSSVACLLSRRLRLTAVVVLLLVSGAFSYRYSTYMRRLTLLKAEVPNIIEYVEKYNDDRGEYPSDLSGYEFRSPGIASYVTYFSVNDAPGGFTPYAIRYHPTHEEGIGHWYSHASGYFYEDD